MKLFLILYIVVHLPLPNSSALSDMTRYSLSLQIEDYVRQLRQVLVEIVIAARVKRCFALITDERHELVYDHQFFLALPRLLGRYYLKISDSEDLLAPNYQTVRILKQIPHSNCEIYFVTLANGIQVSRFLRFIDKYRILPLNSKFVVLHDPRVLNAEMLHIWSNMVSTIFVKYDFQNKLSISTIAYPNILNGMLVTKELIKWHRGQRLTGLELFIDNTGNLNGASLPIAVYEHIPMVMRNSQSKDGEKYRGLEVEIVRALGIALNFQPDFYETSDRDTERIGNELLNGSFTGLIGQLKNRTARMAIGDLHYYKLYTDVIDLSWPHNYECLTFLTPESSRDISWQTLVQPFSPGMWLGVILSLIAAGTIFYLMSSVHSMLLHRRSRSSRRCFTRVQRKQSQTCLPIVDEKIFGEASFRTIINRMHVKPRQKDLFDDFSTCVLLSYSVIMYVGLPRMPGSWPLRVLVGWYWVYSMLVTVAYRASLTAILANPAPRVTIDTLDDLVNSHITATVGGKQNKNFFDNAFDEIAQQVGFNMEIIDDIYGVTEKISNEKYAYYDNEYFLRHLRETGPRSSHASDERVLHIMRECVVNMPVAIGLEKNSPLKPQIDRYIHRLVEAGLTAKWLKDAVQDLQSEEEAPQEAVMDLQKMCSSFVALFIGYILAIIAILYEHWHFRYIVQKHPLFDEYNPNLYYNFKRKFPHL